ncbi:ParB/RepB/Spo0J family partition protein [Gemella sp. zg-570]|uniref:ParB/RepB/Spo0J family partition protein n=1 Tax=unclassified Gemella TaxID=2624949 RepID=UPI001C05E8E4|nr:ParB/RepB/Spo0J family partition protein [Gemella sp. zg-570]MBU0278415.1 ParB/RepB/Spo0J family partition protein [Gemella sp. zg-1178]QWQ38972.1 ParB/RepB/Spo0J family partition protein [Gemella sp. zg-570]
MAKSKGLGKGLGAIFQTENVEQIDDNFVKIEEIDIEKIKKNPYQPRTTFNEEKITELAGSIETNGLLQPIILKKSINGYYIVAGERRVKAFEKLGKKSIPAIVKKFSDEEMMVFGILENLQREDLSVLEEALSYKQLMDSLKITQEELAKKLGKSRPYVTNTLRLLKLPQSVKEMLANNLITAGHAKTLLGLKVEKEIPILAQKVIKENMSVRNLEDYIAKIKNPAIIKKTIKKDIFIEEQENILKKLLGTEVKIKQSRNKKGKIEIEFNDNEEFDRIVGLFRN